MHVLAVTTSYPLRAGMAAGVFVQKLYAHFPNGWSIEVLCPDDDVGGKRSGVSPPVTPVRYAPLHWQQLGQKGGGILPALRANRWRVLLVPVLLIALFIAVLRRAWRVDVIHANWSICGVIAVTVGFLSGTKVVTTLRGEDATGARKSLLARYILSFCVMYSDAVVCVSDAMAESLSEAYPARAGKIHVIRNGVDERFLELARPSPVEGRLRLLAIGSVVKRKGFDVLLAALAEMQTSCQVDLIIAGDGPEREALSVIAKNLPQSRSVVWLGEVPPNEIPDLLSDADALVLSSRSEGRPNVVLEALAAGLPVISTRLPGVVDLVMDGVSGWLVDVEDIHGMAHALELACDVSVRLAKGQMARKQAMERNETWENAGAKYAALFQSLVMSREERN